MRAIHVSRHGGPDVLASVDVPSPTAGPDDLLVDVEAVGVNFIDTYLREGVYPSEPPYIPGFEGSGIVSAVGSNVTAFAVGDRVAWCDVVSSYAEQVAVPAVDALHVPDGVPFDVAGSALLRGLTAHYLLDGSAHPTSGDTVLVHAGAGGVGLILTEWAAARGITVITTVSSDAKAELSRKAGAAHVLRYDDPIADRVRELTDGRGASVVYDGVGASTFDASLDAAAVRGTVVLFGAASGPVPPFDLQRLNREGSLSVTRPSLGHFIADPTEFAWRADEFFGAIADEVLHVDVGQTFPLADAADAHRALEARSTTGATALIP
ncbi:quinone oxidoreductase [Gordonia sp. PDNC005]|uniref:quinone oxidoreductase family protein n=1 Tax=unclassified Gordonia (in: high G+C Gram-positive bacteria) TaxID=2657482 RepID=UPI001963FB2A|nr:quinone oxidoreductase [Gordonia sp. PDNC005]QRY64064.1 quinone oxidoreductase [Gordonia sp. PDNC005]